MVLQLSDGVVHSSHSILSIFPAQALGQRPRPLKSLASLPQDEYNLKPERCCRKGRASIPPPQG